MANQQALDKLIGYWESYTKHKIYKFPWGLAPLKNLFEHLHNIRYWDTEDRFHTTGLVDDWRYRVAEGQDSLPVEIELWCHTDSNRQHDAEDRVRRVIHAIGGQILQSCIINAINYHSLLANLPADSVSSLIHENNNDIELLRCDEVMYFRPSGQCMAPFFTPEEELNADEEAMLPDEDTNDIDNKPIVALLDGLPLENHEWIKDYIFIDDPDAWSDEYSPSDQQHGTSMASLIIRGDMNNSDGPILRKLYCRPIIKPVEALNGTRERIPEDILPIDIVHRAVRRIFEPEADIPAAAPSVRIINLSIADPYRLFDRVMSPWAKLIDYLSFKYKVIFVISAGNHLLDIDLAMTNKEFNDLTSKEKESAILNGLSSSVQYRRLMSPAESINAVTVAAYHHDEIGDDEFYDQINLYTNRTLPSTINPITWGKKRSVKPDVLMPGGRATYRLKRFLDDEPAILEILTYNRPPGQRVASPGNTGSLNSFSYTFGTSNSAALASRRLSFLDETIRDLYVSPHGDELSQGYENVLLKALLCHGASHSDAYTQIAEVIKNPVNSQRFRAITAKYLGYGNVDEDRIHGCLENQATILQCGKIEQDDTHVYKFKLPDALNAKRAYRRLIITLAWLTPINPKNNAYREAHLFFEPATGKKDDNYLDLSRELDWQIVRNGTVQHEVLTGDRATVYASGTNLEIAIQCKAQAGASEISIPYGLIVTLDTPGTDLPIYEEIKAGIEQQFQIQATQKQSV